MNIQIKTGPEEWRRLTQETISRHTRQARGLRRKARIFLKRADHEATTAQKLQAALDHICPQLTPEF